MTSPPIPRRKRPSTPMSEAARLDKPSSASLEPMILKVLRLEELISLATDASDVFPEGGDECVVVGSEPTLRTRAAAVSPTY